MSIPLIRSLAVVVLGYSLSTFAGAQDPIPQPTPPFKGTIGTTYKDSKSDFPQPVKPPKGAPNVLLILILIDDLGFAGTEAYGGLIPTPNIDKLAKAGLTYNEVHNTALCSPSRAALLSGRNHHQVGMAGITEGATCKGRPNSAAGGGRIVQHPTAGCWGERWKPVKGLLGSLRYVWGWSESHGAGAA